MKKYVNGQYIEMTQEEVEKLGNQPTDYSCEIEHLKNQLSESDYKVIKNAECQVIGEALPYEPLELHIERQAIRDRINELEAEAENENI